MKKGKIIDIEGIDATGKGTQVKILLKRLNDENIPTELISFPVYESPTGKIVGGPFLGKEHISNGYFTEGSSNVNPKVSSLYFAADRLYNVEKINTLINKGINVILDRYTYSNMGHQGSKISDKNERQKLFDWIDNLEFKFLGLPRPDYTFLIYLPYELTLKLKEKRNKQEKLDQNEIDCKYQKMSIQSYLHAAKTYNWDIIECSKNNTIKTIEEIHEEIYQKLINYINGGNNEK